MSKPDISKVKVGDKVYGRGEKRAYTVMARNERFIIIAKPFNINKSHQYSIIDLKKKRMGPDNSYNKHDYLNPLECNLAIKELSMDEREVDSMEVSSRRGIALIDFDNIIHI